MSRIFIFQHNQLIGQIQVQLTSTTSTIKYHLNNQHVVSETVMIIFSANSIEYCTILLRVSAKWCREQFCPFYLTAFSSISFKIHTSMK